MIRYLLVGAGALIIGLITSGSSTPTPVQVQPVPQAVVQQVQVVETAPAAPVVQKKTETSKQTQTQTIPELSNDNYYTNSAGNKVHSPAYSDSVPAGASAKCRDGTYSFSQSRRGTCSRHGGVAEWL